MWVYVTCGVVWLALVAWVVWISGQEEYGG